MKLLITTQKVDKNDPILGFFHRWIEEFAKWCEFVTVIGLEIGECHLPANVKVLSLGKEDGVSRIKYIKNFYKYIWQERKNYDAVFIHMNQEYVLLGWKFWKLWGKKIFLWRNHAHGNLLTRLAIIFSDKVFCTSPHSFTARFRKTKIMPVGIDTSFFRPDPSVARKLNSILFLGRISPVKRVEVFVDSLKELLDMGIEFSATIAGGSSLKDVEYEKMIRDMVASHGLKERVIFLGPVNQERALELYRRHEIFVNLTLSGSMDKTIFEAACCGCLPVVSNASLAGEIDDRLLVHGSFKEEGAKRIEYWLRADEKEEVREKLRAYVVGNHSLKVLVSKLMQIFTTSKIL